MITNRLRKFALTETEIFGEENLPKEGGYIMYSNHQGKYDGVGMVAHFKRPFSILWDHRSSKQLITSQLVRLLDCPYIDVAHTENFMPVIQRIVEIVKGGKPFLIYPEGECFQSNTHRLEFQTGSFMASLLSKSTIVPVVLYDSHLSMNTNDIFHRVKTQIHYLKPIPYEEYKSMNRKALSRMVQGIIQAKLDELSGYKPEVQAEVQTEVQPEPEKTI